MMRKRLWFSSFAVALVAVLVVGVPALVIDASHGAAALGVVAVAMAVAAALAGWLTAVLAGRLARPVEELAEAAARLGRGDPRPDPASTGALAYRVDHRTTPPRPRRLPATRTRCAASQSRSRQPSTPSTRRGRRSRGSVRMASIQRRKHATCVSCLSAG